MLHSTSASTIELQTEPIVCPQGFLASGMSCGIKRTGTPDLALILCPEEASAAAIFTRNLVKAAPVVISKGHLRSSSACVRALIINSGCANAATGEEGMKRARTVIEELASRVDAPPDRCLMNSTGVIGEQLPHEKITAAIPSLVESCAADRLTDAATAIMTTDTRPKMAKRTVTENGRSCSVVGIAKGSGMIHPNMATMIGVILTDAQIAPESLDPMLRNAADRSFHRISVDGDTSTNDSVFLLASGAAGAFSNAAVAQAVGEVALDLAEQIVRDGEGASKLIRVFARSAATPKDATLVAQTVATSLLVRTSIAGGDANWGRILMAAGRSGAHLDPGTLTIRINDMTIYADGSPCAISESAMQSAYDADEIELTVDLHQGECDDHFITCDLTEQYVRINAEYRS